MSRRTRQAENAADDDVTGLAGWLYADLLLALTVVFLATISFVPLLTGVAGNGNGKGAASGSTIGAKAPDFTKAGFDKGLSITLPGFNQSKLTNAISTFAASQHLPAGFQIIYARITGGYDPIKDSPDVGTLNALTFSIKLGETKLPYFSSLATNLATSSDVPSGYVKVEFTFVG
jgi:hypothetical protein